MPHLSLATALVIGVACIGSYRAGFELSRMRYSQGTFAPDDATGGVREAFGIRDGRLTLARVFTFRLGQPPPDRGWSFAPAAADGLRVAGVPWLPSWLEAWAGSLPVQGEDTTSGISEFELPLPTLVAACLVPSAARAWRRAAAARARRAFGRCGACGYDLRASPERCPECGTFATVTPAA